MDEALLIFVLAYAQAGQLLDSPRHRLRFRYRPNGCMVVSDRSCPLALMSRE